MEEGVRHAGLSGSIGMRCEEQVAEICESLGYRVCMAKSSNPNWDVLVNGRRVEIKRRLRRKSQMYQIELSTQKRQSGVACKTSEVDAFVINLDAEWFVFPSLAVSRPNGDIPNRITIRTFASYKDAWHVLEGQVLQCERQLGFDF